MRLISFYILSKVLRLGVLLLVISFTWSGVAFGQIIVPTVDTMIHACQTATATPNSIIQINSSITDAVTIQSTNGVVTIQGIDKNVTWTNTTAVANLLQQNAATAKLYIRNLTFNHTTTAGFEFGTGTVGSGYGVTIFNCTFTQNSDAECISSGAGLTTNNQFVIDSCKFSWPGRVADNFGIVQFAGGAVSVNGLLVQNSLFDGMGTSARGPRQTSTSANNIWNLYNCTMQNFGIGLLSTAAFTGKNILLINNTSDVTMSSAGSITFLSNSGFGQVASGAGTNCLYSLSYAREVCDRYNMYLSPSAAVRNAGISITGITQSLVGPNGVLHGNGCSTGNDDIGAQPYSPALCGGYGVGK